MIVPFWVLVTLDVSIPDSSASLLGRMVAPGFIPSHNLLKETFPVRLVSAENFNANPHPEVFLFVGEVLGHPFSTDFPIAQMRMQDLVYGSHTDVDSR
jgi:hypothetical protein